METENINTEETIETLLNKQIERNEKLAKLSLGLSGITLLLTGFVVFTLVDDLSYIKYKIWDTQDKISQIITSNESDKEVSLVSLKDKVVNIEREISRLENNLSEINQNLISFRDNFNDEFQLNKPIEKKNSSYYGYLDNTEDKKTTLKEDIIFIKHQISEKRASYSEEPTLKDNILQIKVDTQQIKNDTNWIRSFK
ncbi:hypothetical protein [Ursidibacter sp. B-7004-1]